MTIPIFHHTFDPTGVSLTYDSGWVILSLVIAAIVTVSIFVPIVEKIEKTLKKNPPKSVVAFVSCTLLGIAVLVVALAVIGLLAFFVPLYLADKTNTTFFTRPMVTSEDINGAAYLDHEQSFVEKYSNEISDAVENNKDLKQYTIADCQLNDPKSILCGGTSLDEVQADKGNSTVTLVPHIEFDTDNAEIETDNPDDEGVNTYFWVEEKESEN